MKIISLGFALSLLLVPPALAQTPRALDNLFTRADLNRDDLISPTEFLGTQARGVRWTDAMHRFNQADIDGDGYLTRLEFQASRGARLGGRPTKQGTFDLADRDEDGFLDPTEYALTEPQVRPWAALMRLFSRMDRDNDGVLSPQEFGIRNLTTITPGNLPWFLLPRR